MSASLALRNLSHNLRHFRLITFDVTDTLLSFRRPPELEYANAVRHLGYGDVNTEAMRQAFGPQFAALATAAPNFGRDGRPQMTWENWWRRFIGGVLHASRPDLDKTAVRCIADHLIDLYETDACWQRTPGAGEILAAVRCIEPSDRRPAVGVISNFDPRLKWLLENVGLRDQLDFVLASYEVGATKPNPQVFDLALKMGGEAQPRGPLRYAELRPQEALHVGDTPKLDYCGARDAGWKSVLISNGDERWREVDGVEERFVFETLTQFQERLEQSEAVDWD